jgi:mRNA-degrading endonuclease RelE of RelBE toxin-antitoxin system
MNWHVELSDEAEQQLNRLPRRIQSQIERAIDALEVDPFQGDVIALRGRQWRGRYRKRVGRYRIIFTPHHQTRRVEISAILIRDEKTYR